MSNSSSVTDLRISLSSSSDHTLSSHPEYRHTISSEVLTIAKFHEVTDLLLEKPNLNSSHLFRADILWDSADILKTKAQHEASLNGALTTSQNGHDDAPTRGIEDTLLHRPAPPLNGRAPHRTVIRRLIPRNQNLDKPLEQSCYLYKLDGDAEAVLYLPHVDSAEHMPWYHPRVKTLAYIFEPTTATNEAALALWHLLFGDTDEVPQRLHRTLLALGSTFLRLARYQAPSNGSSPTNNSDATSTAGQITNGDLDLRPSALKDTILPQHVVQDIYARLKTTYGPSLIASWVEATPPEKHVFEDLSIAAFLVCLWRKMYGSPDCFAGFVDLACGNGLLVYILNQEGWKGWGIDARRRKTWGALGMEDKGLVREGLIVPKPFMAALDNSGNAADGTTVLQDSGVSVHDGIFEPGTFVISNHADELTLWTPLLAALSCPETPLPFLAIPCCSHALSGEKHRFSPKDASLSFASGNTANSAAAAVNRPIPTQAAPPSAEASLVTTSSARTNAQSATPIDSDTANTASPASSSSSSSPPPQHQPLHKKQSPEQGSLLALRASHQQDRDRAGPPGGVGEDKSAYGCLTRKTVQVARRIGLEVTCTLMRIPSTRNVGVVGFGCGVSVVGVDGGADAEWEADVEGECERKGGDRSNRESTRPSSEHWRGAMVRQVIRDECCVRTAGGGSRDGGGGGGGGGEEVKKPD